MSLRDRLRRAFGPAPSPEPDAPPEEVTEPVAVARLDQCQDRDLVDVVGELVAVAAPRDGQRWLQADLSDGTAVLRLVWMGRQRLGGIECGRRLRVRGRVSYVDARRTLHNPRYELLPPSRSVDGPAGGR